VTSGVLRLVLFVAISGGLLGMSCRPLRVVGSHGFYRFFAWEAILALILINSRAWFSDPWSARQIVSWSLLLVSLAMLGLGLHLFTAGKPTGRRQDPTLLWFEKTTQMVTTGIYRYVRHPLYGSLLFLAWGAFLKGTAWYSVCLVVVATSCLVATARADEAECVRYFGQPYREYMKRTRMFVPWLL
jgi:protein-S-isoprenylcysteine O-methyltransferase Ste14